jgi:hypothetical protein
MQERIEAARVNWLAAWSNKVFRMNFIGGLVLLAISMVATSYFFNYIQDSKSGIQLNDWILQRLPAVDVSVFIVSIMGSAAFLFAMRGLRNPNILLTFLFAIILELLARMVTITITGFLPPHNLIVLKDPMGSMLYQYRFISRDLFFSGHTAIVSLLYLCSLKKFDKYYTFLATISVACLLLIQHVHYTVDVMFAPLFAFGCFWLSKKILNAQGAYIDGIENHPL